MKQHGGERGIGGVRRPSFQDGWELAPDDPTGPRFLIEDIYPCVECGRYPIKRIAGESVEIWADIFREGHDVLAAALIWRSELSPNWQHSPMTLFGNDRWHGRFTPTEPGWYMFAIEAWTDQYATWRKEFLLKRDAGQDVSMEAREGHELILELMPKARKPRLAVEAAARKFAETKDVDILLDDVLAGAIEKTETRPDLTRSHVMPLLVERQRARCGAWYEMIPRSQGRVPGRHGTFDDCIERIPSIADLGFDVLYFTPIHPIGHTNRKGKNNSLKAARGDPGSFYAIGDKHGGHDAVHPELGTLEDFRRLVAVCHEHDMEVALDFAVQCSPDHPWLKEHPEWFKYRPDGSIRYAENPPKKYEDIVNPAFTCADRIALWEALRDVVLFWCKQGVRIFRVDNPHTKPFPFWEWMIREVRRRHPDTIFLSEAFTRPKVMNALAKLGFSQSYSYFTWRTSKHEMQEYLSEITAHPARDYFRPNFFVTTPDILPVELQSGEPWRFKSRFALAALLSSNYGIYNGFELLEYEPIPGREEYINSDKYEIKVRDWNKPDNIKPFIKQLNTIRRANPALLQTKDLRFLLVDNDNVIGFLKESVEKDNAVAAAVSFSGHRQEFWLHFGAEQIGPADDRRGVRMIENLVTGDRHMLEWGGIRLSIDPSDPMLVFRCYS